MLVMKWENWDAYKLGIIDENGKRIKSVKLDNPEKKNAYTPFVRLGANIKRLLTKIPGGGTKLGSFAAALFLIKEKYQLTDDNLDDILKKLDIDVLDFLNEDNQWFVLDDKKLSPGIYRIKNEKVVNTTFEPIVLAKDEIKIYEDLNYPIGDVFGMDIYEATHVKTNQRIYITTSEIYK
jgi:hypothetical protein